MRPGIRVVLPGEARPDQSPGLAMVSRRGSCRPASGAATSLGSSPRTATDRTAAGSGVLIRYGARRAGLTARRLGWASSPLRSPPASAPAAARHPCATPGQARTGRSHSWCYSLVGPPRGKPTATATGSPGARPWRGDGRSRSQVAPCHPGGIFRCITDRMLQTVSLTVMRACPVCPSPAPARAGRQAGRQAGHRDRAPGGRPAVRARAPLALGSSQAGLLVCP